MTENMHWLNEHWGWASRCIMPGHRGRGDVTVPIFYIRGDDAPYDSLDELVTLLRTKAVSNGLGGLAISHKT